MSEQAKRAALRLLEKRQKVKDQTRLYRCFNKISDSGDDEHPYQWQADFMNLSADHSEIALIAANQVGKTRTGAAKAAMHATGWYPDWYTGRRFAEPTDGLVAGATNEELRNICQRELVGMMLDGAPDGTGWIPKASIGEFTKRQCGVSNVLDEIKIKHQPTGKWSTIRFKSFEQGADKVQGFKLHWAWIDEEPKDLQFYNEVYTRTITRSGMVWFTRTPLFGPTPLIRKFMQAKSGAIADSPADPMNVDPSDTPSDDASTDSAHRGITMMNVGWDDAPHLDEETVKQRLASLPDHERDARSKGVPMLGSGAVYNIGDSEIACEPFPIPDHYRRICGIDFGINHPAAAAWVAHDADADVVYVYDCYKKRNELPAYHGSTIKSRGDWIPVSWPHDGMNREKGSGKNLAEMYRAEGVKLLPDSARYDDDRGGSQPTEPIVQEILSRMRTGRFKVFRHLSEWFSEKSTYQRDDHGKIVREHDDIMAATNYAVMMLRFARPASSVDNGYQATTRDGLRPDEAYDPIDSFM